MINNVQDPKLLRKAKPRPEPVEVSSYTPVIPDFDGTITPTGKLGIKTLGIVEVQTERMEPGSKSPLYKHPTKAKIVTVLLGELKVLCDAGTEGSTNTIKTGHSFSIEPNISYLFLTETGCIFIHSAPKGYDSRLITDTNFQEIGNKDTIPNPRYKSKAKEQMAATVVKEEVLKPYPYPQEGFQAEVPQKIDVDDGNFV